MREGTESCFAAGIPFEALDMQCPAALCTTRPAWSPVAAASVWARKKSISARCSPVRLSASKKFTTIGLVSFMNYGLGYFDLETRMLEPLENPFGPKVTYVSGTICLTYVSGPDPTRSGRGERILNLQPPGPGIKVT
jgi:hypothetical protein